MRFNNIIKTFGVVSTAPFVALATIACSEDAKADVEEKEEFTNKDFDYSGMDWSEVSYFSTTVLESYSGAGGWNDGDTFTFNLADLDDSTLNGGSVMPAGISKVRLANIDTPEMGTYGDDDVYEDSTGAEWKIANEGKDFANSEMPHGTPVRVITNMATSYDRIVGSVWYGDNFEKSWEVEIMKKGLAQPGVSNSDVILEISKTWSTRHYVAYPMFHGFNYAKNNNLGLFAYEPQEVFQIRGVSDWTAFDIGGAADTQRDRGYIF